MFQIKRNWVCFNCSQRTSMLWCSLLQIFSCLKVFFFVWFSDHVLLVKNDQQWKTFGMIYNMTMSGKTNFSAYPLWHHNVFHVTCLVFPVFWSPSVLLKIGQYTKSSLMIYNLSTFGKNNCGDHKLWRHWYLGNGVLRKMWYDGFRNCFTYLWFWDNKKWDYSSSSSSNQYHLNDLNYQMK